MGFLHEGHLTLMRQGRPRADLLAVSIFVNPTQFGPGEDYGRYPRDLARDCSLMENIPVDVVFAPDAGAMYQDGAQTWIEVADLTLGLCGAHRPGHFRGVATVVAKLFNIVRPDIALFGEKDFQQLRVIQRMVADLDFGIEIVPVPIVREPDGLAMSSRNWYLSPAERADALNISRALFAAREAWSAGTAVEPGSLEQVVAGMLALSPSIRIEYIEAVDALTLGPATPDRPVLVAIAVRIGKTRLIDNIVLAAHGHDGGAVSH
jgi:pantoate--beta-alanine ligase